MEVGVDAILPTVFFVGFYMLVRIGIFKEYVICRHDINYNELSLVPICTSAICHYPIQQISPIPSFTINHHLSPHFR